MALNWYWLMLILKQVMRIFTRGAEKSETSYLPGQELQENKIVLGPKSDQV